MSHSARKTFRDPVHGNLGIPDPLILDLVDTFEFQRLRRIRQLGSCFMVFHGAEHSRFQHALGTMWLMHRVLQRWHEEGVLRLAPEIRKAALAAALLHDIGHGPFSHALEHTFVGLDHERLGQAIITGPLAEILLAHDCRPQDVVALLTNQYPEPVLCELLSGQLDVDRMDYLQRDSIYTGVKYGLFDSERILATLVPLKVSLDHDNLFAQSRDGLVLAIHPKGVLAVEEFLFSRYFMYWQVYLHRAVRSAELMLRLILRRTRELFEAAQDPWLPPNLNFLFTHARENHDRQELSADFLKNYLLLDDFDLFHAIKIWQGSQDQVLRDLCERYLSRQLFKGIDLSAHPNLPGQLKKRAQERYGENWHYYVHTDPLDSVSYGVYRPGSDRPIRTLVPPGPAWQEISRATRSTAILGLSHDALVSGGYLFYDRALKE
ncbi:MAG: HD domain-containing protein [Vulcanimicrobiota bacterium]